MIYWGIAGILTDRNSLSGEKKFYKMINPHLVVRKSDPGNNSWTGLWTHQIFDDNAPFFQRVTSTSVTKVLRYIHT